MQPNLKSLREMRGLTQKELADKIGISPQQLNIYESDIRKPGDKMLPLLSDALKISPAYLRGHPEYITITDGSSVTTVCPIISSTVITHEDSSAYGVYYLVWFEPLGSVLAVILSGNDLITPHDWQGAQPLTPDEIADFDWIDPWQRPCLMIDGLPHISPFV